MVAALPLEIVDQSPVRRADLVRTVVTAVAALAVVVLVVTERELLAAGAGSVARAHPGWLALAAAGTVLMWLAGTVSQLGSIPARVPLPRMFAVEVAGNFANHVLPAGSGGVAVTMRFLRREGLSRAVAVASVGLNLAAGAVVHTALLVVAVLLAPTSLDAPAATEVLAGPLLLIGAGLAAAAAGAAVAFRRRWLEAMRRLAAQLTGVRTPVRAAQLWLGSVAVPLLHCGTLYLVLRAVGGVTEALPVAIAYLVASSVSAAVPSPGGFGSLDLALVACLTAVGEPAPAALATVLAYRLITVWVPLLPGACVLGILLRRRVI